MSWEVTGVTLDVRLFTFFKLVFSVALAQVLTENHDSQHTQFSNLRFIEEVFMHFQLSTIQ